MSNDVYGYAHLHEHVDPIGFEDELVKQAASCGLGCRILAIDEVYGLPARYAPSAASVCFRLSDSPDVTTASYLIDMEDYVAGADIRGLPPRGIDRVRRLIDWINRVITLPSTAALLVVVSDDNEVDCVVELAREALDDRLLADFSDCAPPNQAYVIEP